MNKFFVTKETNTFSDSIECLGLASILDGFFEKIDKINKPEILIENKGFYYQISTSKDITEEEINKCNYFDFIPFIANKKCNKEDLDFYYIDYERQKNIREKFYELKPKERKKSDNPPHPQYDVIRMFANMPGYQKSFYNCRAWKNNFPEFLNYIFTFYSVLDRDEELFVNNLKTITKNQKMKISKINALQDINPDKGKGANQSKADGINPKGQNAFWLKQLIRFTGSWDSFVSRYFDKDIKTYSIVPQKISKEYSKNVYNQIKKYVVGKDSIKMDILMLHLATIELIRHNPKFESEWDFRLPDDKISGFQFAYYKNLGHRPAVTNIGFLGLPQFIEFENEEEAKDWIDFWDEHKELISKIDEGNSSNIEILQQYRQFLSGSDFMAFFNFQFEYATILMSDLNKKSGDNNKQYLKSFTTKKMEVLMKTQNSYQKILSNAGFQAIASAIRNSTIIPIFHKKKKDVIFGLNQKLKIASRNNDYLTTEISNFIQHYNETIMLKDYHEELHKKYVTTEELSEFYKLLDEEKSPKLIAGMLVAYGYAREPKKDENKEKQDD